MLVADVIDENDAVGVVNFVLVFGVIAKLAGKFPIIIASRTESGVTAHTTYGYYGSEITLQEHGAIMANWLSPVKARLLLMTLLANKMDRAQIKQVFDNY